MNRGPAYEPGALPPDQTGSRAQTICVEEPFFFNVGKSLVDQDGVSVYERVCVCVSVCLSVCLSVCACFPQWGAADAKIKVPSSENTELKRSPFKVWSRSVYSHTCYAYCKEFLPCLFLPFQSIHLQFFQNLSQFFPVLACRIK